jgi:hypothetical protein
MNTIATLNPEVDRLLHRLHEDAEFRYLFTLQPGECLEEFDLTPIERELLSSRDQNDWFTYIYGGQIRAQQLLNVVTVKVVTVKVVSGLTNDQLTLQP